MPPESCPHCGADLPPNAKACPECGSDEQTGWSDEAHLGGLNLPDEEFDYEGFVQREFSKEGPVPRGLNPLWWVIGVAVLAAFLFMLFR